MVHSRIIEAINSNKLVFFVGSGFSRNLGFPNWKELVIAFLEDLSKDYPEIKKLNEFYTTSNFMGEIEVLDKIIDHKYRVLKILDKQFSLDVSNHKLNRHKKLGSISSKIITTNYDKALELANSEFQKIEYNNDFRLGELSNTDKYIFKIHGCIDNPADCILFREDYDDFYSTDSSYLSAQEELKKIISDYTIIFLGFSLTDPYVKKQFEYVQTIYRGLKNKPFMITTDEKLELKETEILKIEDWDGGLDNFLESLLDIKHGHENTAASLLVEEKIDNIVKISTDTKVIKIAILIPNPINKSFRYDLNKIIKPFNQFRVFIDYFHLSIDTVNELEEYQYIFIFTNNMQNKIYVEDEYLSSKLITLETLESEMFIENLKGLFIFTDKEFKFTSKNLNSPIVVCKFNEKEFNKLIFKFFKRREIPTSSVQTINFSIENLIKLPQGKKQVNYKKTSLPSEIDSKNLFNFIGRVSDLESLCRKILSLLDGQILTIKASGGLGKTTIIKKLAVEFAERNQFSEGIHFIDCEHIGDFNTFEYKISQCFDLDNSMNLKEHIQLNGLRINKLLILDNFESLLYLEDKNKIKELVAFICDYITVVTTSREWIGFEFEEQFELRAFTTDEGVSLFQKYYTYPIREKEIKVLRSDILENLLNNNPLAIKIITSNIPKSKNMFILKDELEEDFFNTTTLGIEDIFGESVDENIERSNSLYQSINYSYSKLSNKESLLFELLSLFPDGIHMKNFLDFFNDKSQKLTDKEIKSLENKSLIQISSGFIKLQSIVGRFASHKLSKRNNNEETFYYTRAYEYNRFMFTFLGKMKKNLNLSEKNELEIFDKNIENFFKSLEYLRYVKEDKFELLVYVLRLMYYFNIISQRPRSILHLKSLKEFFSEIENSNLLIDATCMQLGFMDGNFKQISKKASENIPLDFALNLYFQNSENIVKEQIFFRILEIHRYGNEHYVLNKFVENNFYDEEIFFDFLFTLGMYDQLVKYYDFEEMHDKDFFYFEVLANLGKIDAEGLDRQIEKTYIKDHLTLMQLNYIKAKMGLIENKDKVKKLVVINPYTIGLKDMIYAFNEPDFEKAYKLYKKAISNLEHIKYYYVEAIFYFSKFLYVNNSQECNEWVNLGKKLATSYNYNFLIYKFDTLSDNQTSTYKPSFISNEINSIELLLNRELEKNSPKAGNKIKNTNSLVVI
ncbi:SIR2 family protein [Fictibacillus phosphorivorans]|uniref:SIR2 family protein n=1 Tax=Fictibacillus phosphorivorans TaxID=1221500 RepID=UPI0012934FBC|nr:SIR2 family protein [Fictibacillus phosphorivorans]MQR95477.1 hypothetical protein [Fictibacillus phosphorivorans]